MTVEKDSSLVKAPMEGGAIVHHKGLFYSIGSRLTSWAPNPNKYATAPTLEGPWTEFKDIAPLEKRTYGSLSTMLPKVDMTIYTTQTWYVRDATGNILSVYSYNDATVNQGQLSQTEANLYGSSRLGMQTLAINVQDQTSPAVTGMTGLGNGRNITFIRGKKYFELTNHLGNVLAVVSDRNLGVSLNSSTVDHYNAVIVNAQDYYPFGMLMPGRGGHIGTGKNIASSLIKNGETVPATLVVNQRANNTPATYMASESISFEDGFTAGDGDEFGTLMVDQANADLGSDNGVSYGIMAKGYRYGFNGKENDNEVKGEGNELDFGNRIYDSRVGRFLSLDPLTSAFPFYSPYQYAGNKPIWKIDLDGLKEEDPRALSKQKELVKTALKIPVIGNEKQGQTRDNKFVFLEGGDGNKFNHLHGVWYAIPKAKEVDDGLAKIKNLIREAANKGGREASGNLEYFLSGKGGTKQADINFLKSMQFFNDAAKDNVDRFYNHLNSKGESLKVIAASLEDGQTRTFSDYWIKPLNSGVLPAMDINTKYSPELEFAYAYGGAQLVSSGNFKLTRKGNTVNITGTITHTFKDIYDWELGMSVGIGDTEIEDYQLKFLEIYKGAKPYKVEASYKETVNSTIKK
jgi:RHS repeat-associated protein